MAARLTVLRLRFLRMWKVILLVAVAATAGGVLCERNDWLNLGDAETGAYDQGLKFFTYGDLKRLVFPQPPAPSKDIVLLAIDDRTFEGVRNNPSYALTFGTWPYSRNVWARVIEHLSHEQARAIVFDMVMDERHTDASGDLALAETLKQTRIPFYLGFSVSASEPEHTERRRLPKVNAANLLGPSLDAGDAVPKAEAGDSFEESKAEAEPAPEAVARALAFPVQTEGLELVTLEDQGQPQLPNRPIPPLLAAVSGFGLVKHEEDGDGKIRRTRFAYTDGSNTYVTLATAVAADLFKARSLTLRPRELLLGERRYAVNSDGTAEIGYGGKLEDRFPQVSLLSVLDDWVLAEQGKERRLPAGIFKNKVVIVAGFAAGTYDVKATPFSAGTPGVVKVAAELQNFLDGEFIVSAPYWLSLLLSFLVALFSATIILVLKSTWLEIGWPLLLFFGFFTVTGAMLVGFDLHVLSALPMAAGEFASVSAVAVNHLFANKDREYLREAFSRYMERDLVDQMVEGRELPKLSGENMEVTAFFSDIRGFSTFSEKLKSDPKTLVRVMNTYLTRVTDVLVKHGACIDKYIGDAVVCLFGAPIRYPDHAIRACRAALETRAAISALRSELSAQGLPDVYTRMGLNSAEMLVGNIGSEQLIDYTAIGDGMNLAARLEAANKAYGTDILIGEGTYRLAQEQIEAREIDLVRVAGKTEAERIYELMALKGQLTDEQRLLRADYSRALLDYRAQRFAAAAEVLEKYPLDGASKTLLARCREALTNPPAEFDGVADLEK